MCLVLVVGGAIDGETMLTHLDAAGLSKYDMPEYLIVTEQLPLGPTGKILKRELSAWIECGRLVPVPIKRRHAEVAA